MRILTILGLCVVALVLLQKLVVPWTGGVGGSFGLRPQTHRCLGIPLNPQAANWLPKNDLELDLLVHLRYLVPLQIPEGVLCLGQDVWFGE